MKAIATQMLDEALEERGEPASSLFGFDEFDDLLDDIAEVINENFIREVEASKGLVR